MSEKTLSARIIMKHDTEINWKQAVNFSPKNGEIIVYDIDSTHSVPRVKIGDGNTNVNLLPFITSNSEKVPFTNVSVKDGKYFARITDYDPVTNSMFVGKVAAENTASMQITINDETKSLYNKNSSRISAGYLKANDFVLFVRGSSGWFCIPMGGSGETTSTADTIKMSATDTTTVADAIGGKADSDHTHTEYAAVDHTHDGYAASDHTHNYAGSSSAGGAATSANKVNKSLTFNNGGSGAASGTTFDGSAAKTISYNTIGAAASSHTHNYAGSSSAGGAATSASKVTNSITFNNGGSGAASGTTFDGSATKTISYNTIGAAASNHSHYASDLAMSASDATKISAAIAGKADSNHKHAASDITSGTMSTDRLPTASTTGAGIVQLGTGATNAAAGNHTHSGYASSTHKHSASDITSGTMSTDRLPTASTTGAGIVQLGTDATNAAAGNHTHSEYAASNHTHDGYAAANHTHDEYVLKAGDIMEGTLVGAATPPATVAFRNIYAGTEEVSETLIEGTIYIQYI